MGPSARDAGCLADEDNPEWTASEVGAARPALDVIAGIFGEAPAAALRRGRGRPPQAVTKINQTLRLDADVLEAFRRQGQGWQRRMNEVLRRNMPE